MKGQTIELLPSKRKHGHDVIQPRDLNYWRIQVVADDGSTRTAFVGAPTGPRANSMFVVGLANWIASKALHGIGIRSRVVTRVVQTPLTPHERAMQRYMAARPVR